MLSPSKKQMVNVNLDTLQSPTKSSSMKYVSPKIVNNEPVAVRKVYIININLFISLLYIIYLDCMYCWTSIRSLA